MSRRHSSSRGRSHGLREPGTLGVLLGLCCAAGCITTLQESLTKRATYELRCPAEQLALTELGPVTYGVDGCGRRAVYVGTGPAGVWKLDSLTDPDGSTARPAAVASGAAASSSLAPVEPGAAAATAPR